MDRISEFAHRVSEFLQQLAESWGGPGLALVAFCDSSFLTLPEVADLLVAVSTIREPHNWFYFAAMTAVGSVLGCYALFLVGRKGGEALVRRGFHERHVDRVLEWFRKHGALVLIIPAMMPPPMPFKAFVLTAGVSGVRTMPFLIAVGSGRLARYGLVAWLARTYGEATRVFIQHNAFSVLWPVLGVAIIAIGGWWLWRRLRTPTA